MKSVIKSRTSQALPSRARITRIIRVVAAVAFAGLFTAACGGISEPGITTSLTISPLSATIPAGGSGLFTVVATNSAGDVLDVRPTWAVVAGGGTINAAGVFVAGTVPGTYTNTVTATCNGVTATATVIVTAGALATINVTPDPANLAPGAQQQFVATGADAYGNAVAITPVWAVVNSGGTIVANSGLFTAGPTQGTYTKTVEAKSGAIADSATVIVSSGVLASITVTPDPVTVQTGATQKFTAVGRDGSGNVIPITPVWSVVNGGGTINAVTGVFTAGLVTGTFNKTVAATSGTLADSATVTVTSTPPPAPIVNLGTAAPFGILAGSTVTCVTGGFIDADIGISPGTALTGFGPCVVTGAKHLADAVAAQAQLDLTAAYNTLVGLPCGTTIVADLGGTTLPAGVYCSASSIGVTGPLTLNGGGDPNATFVFQAGSTLTTAGDIILIGGAQAKNVYWQVGSSATLGVGSQWQGNILAFSSITLNNNVTLIGRALARNAAVSLGTNNVITLP